MSNRLDIQGNKFQLTIDDFSGGLNSETDALGLGASEFATFTNLLNNQRGPARKRGSAAYAYGTSSTPLVPYSSASNLPKWLAVWRGSTYGGSTLPPYYGIGTDSTNIYASDAEGDAGASIGTTGGANGMGSRPFMLNDVLYFNQINTSYNTGGMIALGGTNHSSITTGTATFTTNDATVTLSSALSAGDQTAIVGSFIYNTADSGNSFHAYRVSSVTNSTTLEMDQPYTGPNPGAGAGYKIWSVTVMGATASVDYDTFAYARACVGRWGRVVRAVRASSDKSDISRVVWSGIAGSSEGTAPRIGADAYDANGYIAVDNGTGNIVALENHGPALVAIGETGMTAIYGEPEFDSAGSLDASTVFTGVTCNGPRALVSTPIGLFFYDQINGLMLWRGGAQPPERVGNDKVLALLKSFSPTELAYYRDYLILLSGSDTGNIGAMMHVPTGSWTKLSGDVNISFLQTGRQTGTAATSTALVGLALDSGSGMFVVDVGNMIDNAGDAAADFDGTAISIGMLTGKIGTTFGRFRPRKARMTYKCTDLTTTNPYLTMTLRTGLPGTIASANSWSSTSTTFAETTDVESGEENVQVAPDTCLDVGVTQTNAGGVVNVYGILIEGDYEELGRST